MLSNCAASSSLISWCKSTSASAMGNIAMLMMNAQIRIALFIFILLENSFLWDGYDLVRVKDPRRPPCCVLLFNHFHADTCSSTFSKYLTGLMVVMITLLMIHLPSSLLLTCDSIIGILFSCSIFVGLNSSAIFFLHARLLHEKEKCRGAIYREGAENWTKL